jgi:3D-(3,5/4)-trihydroxycyclohexane-1,2-dione acylhydrolase (decyclizing)
VVTGTGTVRLTVGQAIVRFLAAQRTERDGIEHQLFAACAGVFGHGNVAGLGQALLEAELLRPGTLRYHQARNEQAMVHTAVGFARMRNRLSTWACTSLIGPGATNMVTGAALATISRLPVLLLPGDVFATRPASPVLHELEYSGAGDVSVNDAFRPVSVYFDRIWRPGQLPSALLAATRALTDPAQTGAVTLALPQDVQAEAWDWPAELFADRVWRIPRPPPETVALIRAVQLIRGASRPLIVAGGGVIYAEATDELRWLVEAAGIPVAETQAGKGALRYDHPLALGAIGISGTAAANQMARQADVVIGIGTRYSDVSTASRTAFGHPGVRFVNINIAAPDVAKLSGCPLVADAQIALRELSRALGTWSTPDAYRAEARRRAAEWDQAVERAYALGHQPRPAQSEVIGAVNQAASPAGVVVCATGSITGDLHKLWRSVDPKGYHVEYGYSCTGYEIAGGLGVKLAAPDREVFVLAGHGSYLMMAQELVTAVQERIKLIVVLADSRLDGDVLPVDLAANAQSLGVRVLRATTMAEFRDALGEARRWAGGPVLVHIETDPAVAAPDSQAWWDVPVAEVSELDSTRQARADYERAKADQRAYLAPPESR